MEDPFPKPTDAERSLVRRLARLLLWAAVINTLDLVLSWVHLLYDIDEIVGQHGPDPAGMEKAFTLGCFGFMSMVFALPIVFLYVAGSALRHFRGRGFAIAAAVLGCLMAAIEAGTVLLATLSGPGGELSQGAELRRSLNFVLSLGVAAFTTSCSIYVFAMLMKSQLADLFFLEARRDYFRRQGRL
jgi:hypothetical protein